MKSKTLVTLLFAGASLAAFANPLLDDAERSAAAAPTAPAAAQCPSFAGHWRGTCTGSNVASSDLVVEQNGCSYVKLGDIEASLNE